MTPAEDRTPSVAVVVGQLSIVAATVLFVGVVAVGALVDDIRAVGTMLRFIVVAPLSILFGLMAFGLLIGVRETVSHFWERPR